MINIDPGIQLRCSDADANYINMSFTPSHAGNGIYLYNIVTHRIEYWSIPTPDGVQAYNMDSMFVDHIPGRALEYDKLYYLYAFIHQNTSLQLTASEVGVSWSDPYGTLPLTGWGCRNGDPQDRFIGLVQRDPQGYILKGGLPPPNGVTSYNLFSYYNRQRVSLQSVVSGIFTQPQTSWSTDGINGGMLSSIVYNDGREPIITFSGSVKNNTAGGSTWVGISRNGELPFTLCKADHAFAGQSVPFCIAYPGGTPNFVNGRNEYRIMMACGPNQIVTINGGCLFVGSFEN